MSQDTASPTGAEGPVTATGASREDAAPTVILRIATVAKLNLADFQNAIPAVQELAIVNATRADLQQLTLTLTAEPPFVKPRSWTLERVGAGETYHLSDLDVQLDGALLSRLTEAEPATLRFELRSAPVGPQGAGTAGDEAAADTGPDAPLATQDRVVELLARHQWGGIGQLPEMVAAFVQPNDPAVDRLLKAAAQALEAGGKSGDIDGYKQGAKRAWELASGLWTAVLQQRLNYALPPASFEHTGQKVRGPSQIIDAGLATCLDLTLLFAACLEQANLHPLLVFTRGHAFVGLWLRPEEFSTAVVDDITAVRKRLKLQEMLVFETTLAAQGPDVGFSQAIAHANRQLSEEQEDQFELVVDVKRARMSRIRPLALAQAAPEPAPPADTPVLPLTVEDAPELPEDRAPEAASSELDPKDRLARWQRKLLDLSLRNALLNFKPGKKSLMLEAAAPALEDALAEGQTLKLLPSPDLMQGRDPRNQQLHEARSLEDLRRAHAAEALQRREVFIRLEEQELEGRLVELFRGARNTLQEGGANTLFLALGFLVWTRPDKPDVRVRAPLILLPVTLNRKSARSGFSLRPHEDEARFNPTLVEMLRQDFQLELGVPMGDLPQGRSAEHGDGSEGVEIGLDVQGLWSRVRTAIKDIRGWEVSEDVVLSMFSFAKYLMWKDLVERTDELRQSPVVAHLIDTPREPYRSSVAFPDARRLDTEFKPQQVFCPLPADSSQISAVMAAAAGKDFVLIGPPGTGKSQTIANLIAQCLAQDKRVLFVAEKVAALDVVYRRLREVGLGEFCLELHSSKARKLDVLAQLKQSWESKGEVDEAGWQAKAEQLGRVRQQLSTYVDRLHLRRANSLTVYGAIGRVVTGEGTPELRLNGADVAAHDEATLAELRDLVGRLQANAAAVGAPNLAGGPLALIHRTDWSVRWQQDLVAAARSLRESTEAVIGAARLMCEQMDIDLPALDGAGRASLGQLAQALLQAAGQPWAFCALPNAADICVDLKAGAELLARHRALSAQMSPIWPTELQAQLLDALELLAQRRRLQAELGAPVPATAVDDLARGVRAIEQMNRLRADLSVTYGAGVAQLNVAALQREWAKAEQAVWPVSWLGQRKVRAALEAVIEGAGEPNIAGDLEALVRIRALRTEVEQINTSPALDGLWAGLRTRLDAAQAVLRANAALQSARAERPFSLDGLALAADGQCGERWVAEVGRLQRLHALDRRLADCMPLNGGSDGLWRGHDTDVDLLRAALAFEQARESLQTQGALPAPHALIAEGRAGLRLQQAHTHLVARATLETRLAGLSALAAQCPGLWSGLDTDLEAVERALQFRSAVQASLSLQPENPEALRQGLHWVLSQRAHELGEGAAIGRSCQLLRGRLPLMDAAVAAFGEQAAQPEAERLAFAAWPAGDIAAVAARLDATHTDLRAWCAWRSACAAATSAGLGALVAAVASGEIDPATAPQAFEVNYARGWLAATVDEDEVLKRFVPAEHERRIHEFRALDDEFTAVTRQWIRARLCAGLPAIDSLPRSGAGSTSEWGVLRREITKKRQHLPLRQLLQEIPSAVLRLAPCLLMSPLSIAQYLSAGTSSFDIVIFDEASQIPVWDAIGAMARAKQVVMVGDPKQLPPTNFFDRAESADGDSQDVEADMESILDECLGASLPTRNLSWHYRSRHESLIAFSNHRYYGGALVTFPSPLTEDRAVSFHPVQGRYEKGGARINQPEAKALVADIVARLRSPGFRESGLTVGVVTFNTEQQRLVEDLLDEERRLDPGLEPFFSEMELEPLFVKNLESVQGDERDIMYFSIAYGPDLAGVVSMNFGPLNRDGGERRLNVAVTRARHELRVFSSLRGDQLDLSRTQAAGVRDLKHFLEFAERGSRALAEAHQGSRGDFDSPFEAGVAQALARKGWQVHTQIGASSFRVDLGVVHPDFAGRYLAGVECDGATYHRSATARDRDKLREQVLRGLGWDILRIWSTDWWVNPGGTLERVHERLTALLAQDRERRAAALQAADAPVASAAGAEGTQVAGLAEEAPGLPGDEAAPDAQAVDEARQVIARAAGRCEAGEAARPAGTGITGSTSNGPPQTYARAATLDAAPPASAVEALPDHTSPAAGPFRVANPADAVLASAISADNFYEFSYDALLLQMVEWVVTQEGPVLDTVLARRIARTHGFQRTGSRIQQRVEQIARQHFGQTEEAGGTFYWPQGTPPGAALAFRRPADDDSVRGVQEICEQELLSLAQAVCRSGRAGDEAVTAMAREIGLGSLRAATRGRLEEVLAAAARQAPAA